MANSRKPRKRPNLTLTLPPEVRDKLERLSSGTGLSMSVIVERVLSGRDTLARLEREAERAGGGR